jgi:TonB family protein
MRTSSAARQLSDDDVFSVDEIARAAGVPQARVTGLLEAHGGRGGYVRAREAIRLVRTLSARQPSPGGDARSPLNLLTDAPRAQGVPLLMSAVMHAAMLLAMLVLTSGWFSGPDTEQRLIDPQPARLVFLMTPGPGGGGGGGGQKVPVPPPRAERRVIPKLVRKISSPVPPVRKAPPPPVKEPPRPIEPPKIDPPPVEPPRVDPPAPQRPVDPPPAQTIKAPVMPSPADASTRPGVLDPRATQTPSPGPGAGGGIGSGSGPGVGEGRGAGLGAGDGGGTGGGPFRPGSGIDPPTLVREVKPLYTDEARKQSIEGDVLLEVIVRRDGSVGSMRVLRRLGAGLDERAMEAVRQWRFTPAHRQGAAVDVVAEISVEFRLR